MKKYVSRIKHRLAVIVIIVILVVALLVLVKDEEIGGWIRPAEAGESNKHALSLNDVIILSQKGYDLTWSDFEQYDYIETGSGLYIRVYEINDFFSLRIGGGDPDSEPMYIYLALADDMDTRIDIRDGVLFRLNKVMF